MPQSNENVNKTIQVYTVKNIETVRLSSTLMIQQLSATSNDAMMQQLLTASEISAVHVIY